MRLYTQQRLTIRLQGFGVFFTRRCAMDFTSYPLATRTEIGWHDTNWADTIQSAVACHETEKKVYYLFIFSRVKCTLFSCYTHPEKTRAYPILYQKNIRYHGVQRVLTSRCRQSIFAPLGSPHLLSKFITLLISCTFNFPISSVFVDFRKVWRIMEIPVSY